MRGDQVRVVSFLQSQNFGLLPSPPPALEPRRDDVEEKDALWDRRSVIR